jgi:hypothetical protein
VASVVEEYLRLGLRLGRHVGSNRVPTQRVVPVFSDVVRELRKRTVQLLDLPAGEELVRTS